MVRLRDRANHESVDHLLDPRPCLRLTGNAGYIALNESEDIRPPWTAEFWVYRSSTLECAINTCRKALAAKDKRDELHDISESSKMNMLKGEEMLADLAKKVAKNRSPDVMKEKERVTEQLIQMAKENEDKIRAFSQKKMEYRMLIKASSRLLRELDGESVPMDSVVNDITPAESGAPPEVKFAADADAEPEPESSQKVDKDELALSKLSEDERAAVLRYRKMLKMKHPRQVVLHTMVQEGFDNEYMEDLIFSPQQADSAAQEEEEDGDGEDEMKAGLATEPAPEPKRSETETNTPHDAEQPSSEEAPKTPDVPYSVQLDAQLAGPPPDTAASSNRPFTTSNKMAPPPPIDWKGDGNSFAQFIHAEALGVSTREKEEEASLAATIQGKIEAKEEAERAKGKDAKAKKGRRGRNNKAERKEKRKKQREDVHGVRLEEKIRLETVGTGGLDILSSSKKYRLALSVGAEGKVGFSVAGKGEYTVNTVVKRGRWTHIAYVAFKPPKKRVVIYVDGRLIGYEDGVKCYLPFDKIGSDTHCLQGFVQEVRYWGTQRSKHELRDSMHKLLPLDATEQGLLGWWTLEEGDGRYSFDVTEQRYQSRICGRGTKWVTQEDLEAEPPTPSWRERACCQVEIRRAKLAKAGRQQLAPVECPYGCGVPLLKKDLRFHTTYMCKEIVQEPPDWLHGNVRDKRAALAEEGRKQLTEVECPLGCDELIKRKDLRKHMRQECEYRTGRCKHPGCGLSIPLVRLEAHEKFFCESAHAMEQKAMVARVRKKYGYREYCLLSSDHFHFISLFAALQSCSLRASLRSRSDALASVD